MSLGHPDQYHWLDFSAVVDSYEIQNVIIEAARIKMMDTQYLQNVLAPSSTIGQCAYSFQKMF